MLGWRRNVSVYVVLLFCCVFCLFIACILFSQANIALFEARCKEKIQQFEDAGSDEEDIWDEKDVTFAPESQRRPRWASKHVDKKKLKIFKVQKPS